MCIATMQLCKTDLTFNICPAHTDNRPCSQLAGSEPVPTVLTKETLDIWQLFEDYYHEALQAGHAPLTDAPSTQQFPEVQDSSEPFTTEHVAAGMLVRLSEIMDPELQTLGTHVQLTKQLGKGGFGSVFAGVVARVQQDTAGHYLIYSSGKFVAVKIFQPVQPDIEGMRLQQQICRELEAMQWLCIEPHVVKLLAHGELDPCTTTAASHQACSTTRQRPLQCAVLELIPNSLQRTLNYVGVLGEEEAKVAARQLAKQLTVMHSGEVGKIIVHCDIKPDNVLVKMAGEFLLSDFGGCVIASAPWAILEAVTTPVLEVGMHRVVASPYYAAPELYHRVAAAQANERMHSGGQGAPQLVHFVDFKQGMITIDSSIDVFSLGVLVLRMLVGPFERLMSGAPHTLEQVDQWEQVLAAIVDKRIELPDGLQLSDAALQFISCACGVGQARDIAQQQGAPKRTPAAELLLLPWLR